MVTNPTIPTLVEPKGVDAALESIATYLQSNVSWLTNAYGRAETMEETTTNGKRYIYPAVYAGSTEYLNVHPDEHLDNHSFFRVDGRQDLTYQGPFLNGRSKVTLVVWFNYETAYPADHERRSVDNAIHDVVEVLNNATGTHYSFMIKEAITEGMYRGYTLSPNQPLMRPYGAFAITMDINWRESC
jgi:hypothetical protein